MKDLVFALILFCSLTIGYLFHHVMAESPSFLAQDVEASENARLIGKANYTASTASALPGDDKAASSKKPLNKQRAESTSSSMERRTQSKNDFQGRLKVPVQGVTQLLVSALQDAGDQLCISLGLKGVALPWGL